MIGLDRERTRSGNAVAVVTIDDPASRNALTVESATQLIEVYEQVAADPTVGALVLRGAGGTFCSGADQALLDRAAEDPVEAERYDERGTIYRSFLRLGEVPVPTVAAVRGAAVGAGVNLMLAADLCLIAADAQVLSGFGRIGLHPGGGHFALLGRAAGRQVAAACGLFGEELTGAEAAALGLARRALPDADVEDAALRTASRVADDPPLARRMVSALRAELGPPPLPWPAAAELERAPQLWSLRRRGPRRPTP